MKLELKAKHFEGTEFCPADGHCAIEKAYINLTGSDCCEGTKSLNDYTKDLNFRHEYYGLDSFDMDMIEAKSHNFDETVIRTIEMTEV